MRTLFITLLMTFLSVCDAASSNKALAGSVLDVYRYFTTKVAGEKFDVSVPAGWRVYDRRQYENQEKIWFENDAGGRATIIISLRRKSFEQLCDEYWAYYEGRGYIPTSRSYNDYLCRVTAQSRDGRLYFSKGANYATNKHRLVVETFAMERL